MLTWVAVVLDCASEGLLVVVELERSQTLVFQSLSGDNVDGRLLSSCTFAVGMVPLLWCWNKENTGVKQDVFLIRSSLATTKVATIFPGVHIKKCLCSESFTLKIVDFLNLHLFI